RGDRRMVSWHERAGGVDGSGEIGDLSIELLVVDRFENIAHRRPRSHAELEQVPSQQDWSGRTMLDAERAGSLEKPVHCLAVEGARRSSEAVGLGEPRQQFEVNFLRKAPKGAVADFVAHLEPHAWFQMLCGHAEH